MATLPPFLLSTAETDSSPAVPTALHAMHKVSQWFDDPDTLFTHLHQEQMSQGYGLKKTRSSGRITDRNSPWFGKPSSVSYGCERGGKPTPYPRRMGPSVSKRCGCPFKAIGSFYVRRAKQGLPAWGLRIEVPNHTCVPYRSPEMSANNRRYLRAAIEASTGVTFHDRVGGMIQTGLSCPAAAKKLQQELGFPVTPNDVKNATRKLKIQSAKSANTSLLDSNHAMEDIGTDDIAEAKIASADMSTVADLTTIDASTIEVAQ